MELRDRNHRSRFRSRRSTKDRREYGDDEPTKPTTDRDRFSVTRNARQPKLDPFYMVRKLLPWVIGAAVLYWLLDAYVF